MFKAVFLLSVAICIFSKPAFAQESKKDHPIFYSLLLSFEEPQAGKCIKNLVPFYQEMASLEKTEVSFVGLDRMDGLCEVMSIGEGGENFVELDIELFEAQLEREDVSYLQNAHTHVIANVSYFSDEGPEYNGEVMFASEAQIKDRQVPDKQFAWLKKASGSGEIPGHNMSPPSIVDFKFLLDRKISQKAKAENYDSVVVTSGGVWYYRAEDESKIQSARETLDSLVSYAVIYEKANSTKPVKNQKVFKALTKMHQEDPETGPMIRLWQAASMELRAPYSSEAIAKAKAGDLSLLHEEYQNKVEWAGKFSEFMNEMGVQTRFESF